LYHFCFFLILKFNHSFRSVGRKTALLQAEVSACVLGLANVLFCALAFSFFFVFMQQKFLCQSVVCFVFLQ